MNCHYPQTNKQWVEKVKLKRLIEKLSKDDEKNFEFLHNIINIIPLINSKECFDMHNILFNNKLEEINFNVIFLDINDKKEKLPFDLLFNGDYLKEKWNTIINKDSEFNNEEFIKLVKKYIELYYLIKTLDLNIDYIRTKIKKLYPDFYRLNCDYTYKFKTD